MNTRSRLATAISVATLTVSGAVAHSSGALRTFGDDATRVPRIPHVPPTIPHTPPLGARKQIEQALEESAASKTVACAAIAFFEVAGNEDSTFEDFAKWAWDEVDQSPSGRAERIYDAAWSLYVDGDLSSIDDLVCEL